MSIRVGIVGTGFAAARRAEAFNADERAVPLYVTGHDPATAGSFAATHRLKVLDSWESLVNHPDLDLVTIATINRDHAPIARAALKAGKNVIIEYPLAMNPDEGRELIELAGEKGKLLHVEHIELLGGLHRAQKENIDRIGAPYRASYATIAPDKIAPRRWTYNRELFGFPLIAAVSRIHRLTDLFGRVESVSCSCRYWTVDDSDYFLACLCDARLNFQNGVIANVTYGKGEVFTVPERAFSIHGDRGSLLFDGDEGKLIFPDGHEIPLGTGERRGLFAKDTSLVLDRLLTDAPLYVSPLASLYALEVAHAAYRSSLSGKTVFLT